MKFDVSALNDLAIAKNAPFEDVVKLLVDGLTDAYSKVPNADPEARVDLNTRKGELTIVNADGDDVTPANFGNIATTSMRQAVQMWVKELDRRAKTGVWADRAGTLATGRVKAHAARNSRGDVVIDLGGGVEGVMPSGEAVPGEVLKHGQEVTVYVNAVNANDRGKVVPTVSRRQPDLIAALVAANSPEVRSGDVEVLGVSREPGVRAKLGVRGRNALEAVVGAGGYRARAVAVATGGERLDVVVDPGTLEGYVAAALTPAKDVEVVANPDVPNGYVAYVPADQLSLAIGAEGRNARMAAKLTGVRLEVRAR